MHTHTHSVWYCVCVCVINSKTCNYNGKHSPPHAHSAVMWSNGSLCVTVAAPEGRPSVRLLHQRHCRSLPGGAFTCTMCTHAHKMDFHESTLSCRGQCGVSWRLPETLAVPRPVVFVHNFSQWPPSPRLPAGTSLILTPRVMLRWSSLFCLWQQAYHSQISHINHIYAGIQSGFCYLLSRRASWMNPRWSQLSSSTSKHLQFWKKNCNCKLSFSLILGLEHFCYIL